LIKPHQNGYLSVRDKTGATNVTIRNGLYHITVEMLDGVKGGGWHRTRWQAKHSVQIEAAAVGSGLSEAGAPGLPHI
jgi:hypothetical protein